ncbi:MAG: hypothetical protein U0V73_14995 [Acidimicrobiia bacterium]
MTDPTYSLPPQFADLARFGEWILPTEPERFAKRLASTMDELQDFYDAAFEHFEDAAAYLKQVPYDDDMPEDAKNLMWLYCSLVTISFAIECWRQPYVPDSGAASIDAVLEPAL